jgi:hypothetical protein
MLFSSCVCVIRFMPKMRFKDGLAGGKFHRSCCQDHKVRSSWWCLLGENWQSFFHLASITLHCRSLSRNAWPASIIIDKIALHYQNLRRTIAGKLTKFWDCLERLHKNWGRIKPTNNYGYNSTYSPAKLPAVPVREILQRIRSWCCETWATEL